MFEDALAKNVHENVSSRSTILWSEWQGIRQYIWLIFCELCFNSVPFCRWKLEAVSAPTLLVAGFCRSPEGTLLVVCAICSLKRGSWKFYSYRFIPLREKRSAKKINNFGDIKYIMQGLYFQLGCFVALFWGYFLSKYKEVMR